jgi:acylphosphatase
LSQQPVFPLSEIIRGFRVCGKVQGVFFRHSTRIEAERLGIRGIARNLADGSVEVFAQGGTDALQALRQWLNLGPPQARVDSVEEIEIDPAALDLPKSFQVR